MGVFFSEGRHKSASDGEGETGLGGSVEAAAVIASVESSDRQDVLRIDESSPVNADQGWVGGVIEEGLEGESEEVFGERRGVEEEPAIGWFGLDVEESGQQGLELVEFGQLSKGEAVAPGRLCQAGGIEPFETFEDFSEEPGVFVRWDGESHKRIVRVQGVCRAVGGV